MGLALHRLHLSPRRAMRPPLGSTTICSTNRPPQGDSQGCPVYPLVLRSSLPPPPHTPPAIMEDTSRPGSPGADPITPSGPALIEHNSSPKMPLSPETALGSGSGHWKDSTEFKQWVAGVTNRNREDEDAMSGTLVMTNKQPAATDTMSITVGQSSRAPNLTRGERCRFVFGQQRIN